MNFELDKTVYYHEIYWMQKFPKVTVLTANHVNFENRILLTQNLVPSKHNTLYM